MNQKFASEFTACLEELVSGLAYHHKPTGELRPPQIIDTMLERPSGPVVADDEYPLVRWLITDGGFARKSAAPFTVIVDNWLYTPGSIDDGLRNIAALTMALGKVVNRPWFSPYKLRNLVRFEMGSREQNSIGIQPHPYYTSRLFLEFTVAKFSATEE